MASAFGHALAAGILGRCLSKKSRSTKVILLGIGSSILPDADVLSFQFGIPYASMWGHRGISHSILFAILWAALLVVVFHKNITNNTRKISLFFYYALATISHGLLDAMTTGGKGVAFFAPFQNDRYFLPWRPIKVSPIGASKFFSEWGLKVLLSEAIWIGGPALILYAVLLMLRKVRKAKV